MKAKTKGETPQHNTRKPKAAKNVTHKGYLSNADADLIWMNPINIKNLIKDMYETIKNDEEMDSILAYLVKKEIPRMCYYRWKAMFPELADAHDAFNSIIGDRLFKRVKYDPKTIHTVMPEYDEHVWKKMIEYHNNLKKDLAVSSSSQCQDNS